MISGIKLSERILKSKFLVILLIILNIIGFGLGIYYYMPQLDETPEILWLIVVDCPLHVLLLAIILSSELSGSPLPDVLKFINTVGLIKYGFWTVIVILLNLEFLFSLNPVTYSILLPMHVGMILESILLFKLFRPNLPSTLFVMLFFLFGDFYDYVLGTLPHIPDTHVSLLFFESVIVSILLPALIYINHRTKPSST